MWRRQPGAKELAAVCPTQPFPLGYSFPSEGFVQASIEKHFAALGFIQSKEAHADYYGKHPDTGEEWFVEAKGKTSDVGLDFRTGLGQLLQGMKEPNRKYAIAIPDIPQFIAQCNRVSERVRELLQIHWLIVGEDGVVRVVCWRANEVTRMAKAVRA